MNGNWKEQLTGALKDQVSKFTQGSHMLAPSAEEAHLDVGENEQHEYRHRITV